MPITRETHTRLCSERCHVRRNDAEITAAAQVAQDAMEGYTGDYANKRNPIGTHEVKEWRKGQQTQLAPSLATESVAYAAKRHTQRLMSDLVAKGTVRGQVESTNLLTNCAPQSTTAAEMLRSSRTVSFHGALYLKCMERTWRPTSDAPDVVHPLIDRRNPARKKTAVKDMDLFYGHRGPNPRLHYLSPYEFTMRWEVQLATYPLTTATANTGTFHTNLTEAGKAKIATATSPADLDMLPGIDYVVGCGDGKWLPSPATEYTERFRHS